jgi:ribonuclease Z
MKKALFILLLPFLFASVFAHKLPKDSNEIFKVTLLGTGYPEPRTDRFGPATLVQAGNTFLLFDVGRGCLIRLQQSKVKYNQIDAVFFTHLHSDHIVGFPDLWLTGWNITKCAVPLKVFGPEGTRQMTDNLQKAYTFDIKTRIEDGRSPVAGSKIITTEIKEGVVYEKNGIKVIAFLVDHFPVVPAYGYRIEYKGHSVVLSGDTRYCPNLIKFAKGTDLLIHEILIAPDTVSRRNRLYPAVAHHITPEQAAEVFNCVKPKIAVYTHVVEFFGATDDDLLRRTKAFYNGKILVGKDLMSFIVGDKVMVQ